MAIWGAAKAGDLAEVQRLVGQDPRLLNAKDPMRATPLMRAAREGPRGGGAVAGGPGGGPGRAGYAWGTALYWAS
jgi:hypothetical protein